MLPPNVSRYSKTLYSFFLSLQDSLLLRQGTKKASFSVGDDGLERSLCQTHVAVTQSQRCDEAGGQ